MRAWSATNAFAAASTALRSPFSACLSKAAYADEAIASLREWGLVDTLRERYPEPDIYSYWDYRKGDFHQRRGMRIDYLLSTPALAQHCRADLIDRNARKGTKPSDHAPVLADFDV